MRNEKNQFLFLIFGIYLSKLLNYMIYYLKYDFSLRDNELDNSNMKHHYSNITFHN